MGTLEDISNMLKGVIGQNPSYSTDPSKFIPASQNPPYPTSADVNFARQNDYSYGSPYASEFEGKNANIIDQKRLSTDDPTPFKSMRISTDDPRMTGGEVGDVYGKAQLASERSALAKLGYNPTETALDFSKDPRQYTLGGLTIPESYLAPEYKDVYPKNLMYAKARDPSAIIHESIHRGIDKLSGTPFWNKKWDDFNLGDDSEHVVRYLMQTKMGGPEGTMGPGDAKQVREAMQRYSPNELWGDRRRQYIDEMENAAAQYIMSKHPGGPR